MAKHVNHIIGGIARLASTSGQEKYVVGGTRESYWVVEELWNEAWAVIEAITEGRGWGAAVDSEKRSAIKRLEEVLTDVKESIFADLDAIGTAQLIRNHAGWQRARAAAQACMKEMGVEITTWERDSLDD